MGDMDLVHGAGGAVFVAEIFKLDNIPEVSPLLRVDIRKSRKVNII